MLFLFFRCFNVAANNYIFIFDFGKNSFYIVKFKPVIRINKSNVFCLYLKTKPCFLPLRVLYFPDQQQ